MTNKYFFTKDNEYIQNKIKTKQFELSEKILDKRYELKLGFYEMAELLELSPEDYIDYEYGDTSIPVESYLKVLEQLDKYSKSLKSIKTVELPLSYTIGESIHTTNVENRLKPTKRNFKKEYSNKFDYCVQNVPNSFKLSIQGAS